MSTTTGATIPPSALAERGSGEVPASAGQGADLGRQAREQGREVARSAADHARSLVDETKHQLRTQGDEQGRRMAGSLRAIGEDLHSMGEASTGVSPAGEVVRTLADLAQRWAGRLEQDGVGGIGSELGSFGRRRPLVFLSASLGAGFLAGRVARNVDTHEVTRAIGDAPGAPGSSPDGPDSSGGSTAPQTSGVEATDPGTPQATSVGDGDPGPQGSGNGVAGAV